MDIVSGGHSEIEEYSNSPRVSNVRARVHVNSGGIGEIDTAASGYKIRMDTQKRYAHGSFALNGLLAIRNVFLWIPRDKWLQIFCAINLENIEQMMHVKRSCNDDVANTRARFTNIKDRIL